MRDGDTFDANWAWGYIQSNTPNGHGSSNTKRDKFRMRLISIRDDALYGINWLSVLFSVLIMIVSLSMI
jgi:hypothetical protein